jgi:hypothetical protein
MPVPPMPGIAFIGTAAPGRGYTRSVGNPSLAGGVCPLCRCNTVGTGRVLWWRTTVRTADREMMVGPG